MPVTNIVCVLNLQINDEEYDCILKDMKEEALQFGTLLEVKIPRPLSDLSFQEGVGKVFLQHFLFCTSRSNTVLL